MQRLLNGKRGVLLVTGGAALGSSVVYYQTSDSFLQKKPSPYHAALDERTFTTWRLTHKEAVSATNAIFTLRPPAGKTTPSLRASGDSVHGGSSPYDRLWKNGTWSVTIKQPQLQVAREYTPLPPLPHPFYVHDDEIPEQEPPEQARHEKDERQTGLHDNRHGLRFLIRKDGETSAYIHRRDVDSEMSSAVEVRGPTRELEHLGLDRGGVEELIFLAGGTGIAPAMQLAHGLLLRKALAYEDYAQFQTSSGHKVSQDPPIMTQYSSMPVTGDVSRMTILWANRNRQECQGGATHEALQKPQMTWWQRLRGTSTVVSHTTTQSRFNSSNPIVLHLRSLERSFDLVSMLHSNSAAGLPSPNLKLIDHGSGSSSVGRAHQSANSVSGSLMQNERSESVTMAGPCLEVGYFVDAEKTFISKSLLNRLVTRPVLPQFDRPIDSAKVESARKKLIIISGPDGFVDFFAGPRELVNGRVAQGKLGGLLGELKREGLLEGWDVVKL